MVSRIVSYDIMIALLAGIIGGLIVIFGNILSKGFERKITKELQRFIITALFAFAGMFSLYIILIFITN